MAHISLDSKYLTHKIMVSSYYVMKVFYIKDVLDALKKKI